MKRLMVTLVGMAVFCGFAASAGATYSLTLGAPATVPAGGTLTFAGGYPTGYKVWVREYAQAGCSGELDIVGSGVASPTGYSIQYTLPTTAPLGAHYYRAWGQEGDLSDCVTVTIEARGTAPPASRENNVFLCYSTYQTDPGVFGMRAATALLAQGYWSPYAVQGIVAGGTNIGGYHLVCNLAAGQAAGDSTLGGAGEVYGAGSKPDVQGVPGHYPVLGQ